MPSCVLMKAEQGQLLEKCKEEDTQSITGRNNDMDTHIDGASGGKIGEIRLESSFMKPKKKSVNLSVQGFS